MPTMQQQTVQPGDLIALSRLLRKLMTQHDSATYQLGGNFRFISPELEKLAVEARRSTAAAAEDIYNFLTCLETTAAFTAQRRRYLETQCPTVHPSDTPT